jgi:hypothetical protein
MSITYLCRGGTRRYHKVLSLTVQGITGYFPVLQRKDIPCDSEYSLIFRNSGIQIYQGIRKVFMAIFAICMCANGTIVTDIFVGSVQSRDTGNIGY